MYIKIEKMKGVIHVSTPTVRVPVQRYEEDFLSSYQNFLYRRAIYGITIYSLAAVQVMNKDKKSKIIADHAKAQYILNLWKQEIVNRFTNRIFERYFPKTEAYQLFCVTHRSDTDPEEANNLSFKDLRITKKQIIDKLIESGVLPKYFYSLKKENHAGTNPDKRPSHARVKL